jgi:L-methionine (R)-S-oxide reductase
MPRAAQALHTVRGSRASGYRGPANCRRAVGARAETPFGAVHVGWSGRSANGQRIASRRDFVNQRRYSLAVNRVAGGHQATSREQRYRQVRQAIAALLDGEDDWIAALATTACELHHAFEHFHWTGFYRAVGSDQLVIGPYQGAHGCLRIPFSRGVCGAAARERVVQRVDDVAMRPDHIACSSATRSEIVVPVLGEQGRVLAVLDVDSNELAAFSEVDEHGLSHICGDLAARFPHGEQRAEDLAAEGAFAGRASGGRFERGMKA